VVTRNTTLVHHIVISPAVQPHSSIQRRLEPSLVATLDSEHPRNNQRAKQKQSKPPRHEERLFNRHVTTHHDLIRHRWPSSTELASEHKPTQGTRTDNGY